MLSIVCFGMTKQNKYDAAETRNSNHIAEDEAVRGFQRLPVLVRVELGAERPRVREAIRGDRREEPEEPSGGEGVAAWVDARAAVVGRRGRGSHGSFHGGVICFVFWLAMIGFTFTVYGVVLTPPPPAPPRPSFLLREELRVVSEKGATWRPWVRRS